MRMRRYVADLLIALLQDCGAATVRSPVSQADRNDAARGLPEPLMPGSRDVAAGGCLHDESLKSAMVQVRCCNARPLAVRPGTCCSSAACVTGM